MEKKFINGIIIYGSFPPFLAYYSISQKLVQLISNTKVARFSKVLAIFSNWFCYIYDTSILRK